MSEACIDRHAVSRLRCRRGRQETKSIAELSKIANIKLE
jgi:hypothetical protein